MGWPVATMSRMLSDFRVVILLIVLSARAGSAAPPMTFMDEAGSRFITIETTEGGRVDVSLRTVAGPGAYGRWSGRGEQKSKGIEFSQAVDNPAAAGPVYVATGGQARLTVKLKPGQPGVQDAGLSGVYRHVSDEKIASLAKRDEAAADKNLDEAIRMASRKALAEDKPAYVEWKRLWPGLRDQLVALLTSRGAGPSRPTPAVKAVPGQATALPPEKQAAYWMQRAETTAAAINFISAGVPLGVKSGWDGNYDDGFGGSIEIVAVSNGDARFILKTSRGPDGAVGSIEGRMPAKTMSTAKDGTSKGVFTDRNPELKQGEQQILLHFRRIGHFLVIESQHAERYTGKGWFDGVYLKRPPPKQE